MPKWFEKPAVAIIQIPLTFAILSALFGTAFAEIVSWLKNGPTYQIPRFRLEYAPEHSDSFVLFSDFFGNAVIFMSLTSIAIHFAIIKIRGGNLSEVFVKKYLMVELFLWYLTNYIYLTLVVGFFFPTIIYDLYSNNAVFILPAILRSALQSILFGNPLRY